MSLLISTLFYLCVFIYCTHFINKSRLNIAEEYKERIKSNKIGFVDEVKPFLQQDDDDE